MKRRSWGGFGEVLGRFWGGFGEVLGRFWGGFGEDFQWLKKTGTNKFPLTILL